MIATFVLTPGRCGTQWLSQQLQSSQNHAVVVHEPLHFDYEPLHNSPSQPLNKNSDKLLAHLNAISDYLGQGNSYVECGFPCWRHLSWFQQALSDKIKVIHIHRDPVENAESLLKLNAFVPPILPHLPEKLLFHPQAQGALMPEYAGDWPRLSPFEKCLYYWAEVNLQAELYKRQFSPNHWLTIPYDDLFCESSLRQISAFLDVPFEFHSSALGRVDRFQGMPQSPVCPAQIHRHPKIKVIAARLGYEISEQVTSS